MDSKHLTILVTEAVATRWLIPRLPMFQACYPDVVVVLETAEHVHDRAARRNYDLSISYAVESRVAGVGALEVETLFDDVLAPVCSPAMVEERGSPNDVAELLSWPLLYRLGSPLEWECWSARQDREPPDLSRAWGFRLDGALLKAATAGIGVALGRCPLITGDLSRGELVRVLDAGIDYPLRCCLVSPVTASRRRCTALFRDWIRREAATSR